ncbi:MAG TPA: glycosyltransferase family 4 protein [Solirubrobacterales bacterium]|nr:glycosyltransferase family 4 protein [Solirubrobacterales bacterium]
MRVLAVGNMYPPHHLGGYELMWRSAMEHLRSVGHEVRVLTTDHREDSVDPSIEDEPGVHRELRWYWRDHAFPELGLRARFRLERHNDRVMARHLAEFDPQVVNWWAMGGMSMSLIEGVRRTGVPAAGVVVDDWMLYGPGVDGWQRAFGHRGVARLAEPLSGIATRLELAQAASWVFVSDTVRRRAMEGGWEVGDATVAHGGTDPDLFPRAPARPWTCKLLYVGRVDPRKGIATAIRAVAEIHDATLAVVGGGDERHLAELQDLVRELGVGQRVRFARHRREELAGVYASADAVLFPTLWEEPWGLVPLEAMSVGRPVIATGTGGSGEYLRDGVNCLLFSPPEGSIALAEAIRRLARDPDLRSRLREGGFATAGRLTEDAFNRRVAAALARAGGG